jgi:hypothetical protein
MDDNDNVVPEANPANADLGAPRLDADRPTEDTMSYLDNLLDEAEKETSPVKVVEPEPARDLYERLIDPALQAESASPEPVAETPVTDPVTDPVASFTPPPVELDPEITAIPQPRNLSETNQNNWRKLQETATNYKKQAAEYEYKIQELSQQQQNAQTPPDYEELKKFRAIFDTENDPSFKSKYDVPIQSAKEGIYNILRKNGANDDLIQTIEKAGGPDKIDQNWWKTQALDRLGFTDSERLKKHLIDVVDLKEGREREIGETAEKRDQFLEQRQTELVNEYHQSNREIQDHVLSLTKDIPWANFRDPSTAKTEQDMQAIQKHNAAVNTLGQKFTAALYPVTPQARAEVAAAAVASHVLAEQLRYEQTTRTSLQSKLDALSKENNALKNAGRVPKTGTVPPGIVKSNDLNSRIKMSASDAIDLGLDEAGN